MKLPNDVTLLFLLEVNNDIFIYFFMSQVSTMKLTTSMDFCYISDRIACAVEVNIKETFMGNNGFLQTFTCGMDFSQGIKDLLLDKFSI